MAYGELNGHITDDVTWPRMVKVMTPITLSYQYLETAGDAISTVASY